MINEIALAILLTTTLHVQLHVHASQASDTLRAICMSSEHSLDVLVANITATALACARQCHRQLYCNYMAVRGDECLLGFGTTPCDWNAGGGETWVTYVKVGALQTCYCKPGMVPFRDRCYIFPNGDYNWTEAFDICADLGADMVELGDLDEHNFLVNQTQERGYYRLWLGGGDYVEEGVYRWNSGEPLNFTMWFPTEPNANGDEDYLELFVDHGAWNDVQGSFTRPVTCELGCH